VKKSQVKRAFGANSRNFNSADDPGRTQNTTTVSRPEIQVPKKKHGKKNWPAEVGATEKSSRTLISLWKKVGGTAEGSLFTIKILAVETDPDHPTDAQARLSPQAYEWAKARAAERAQLEKYGVFTHKSDKPRKN